MKITRTEIEAYAWLAGIEKQVKEQKTAIGDRIRESIGESASADGYINAVKTSAAPKVYERVDYRTELVNAIGIDKVIALEAAQSWKPGTPRLTVETLSTFAPKDAAEVGKLRTDWVAKLTHGLAILGKKAA